MDKVYSSDNLWKAYGCVAANRGAAGMDHQTIDMYRERLPENLEHLSQALREEAYRPQAVRRVPTVGHQSDGSGPSSLAQ